MMGRQMKASQLLFKRSNFSLGPLTFDFSSPGIYFIVGRNGSGKTSLLRILLGRLPLHSGDLQVDKMPIGYVGVEPLLFDTWTIKENFEFLRSLFAKPVAAEVDYELRSFWSTRFRNLSLGQKRRCELSIALSLPFSTYLFDEPMAHLDLTEKEKFQTKILERSKEARIIVSVHSQEQIFGDFKGELQL